MKKSLCVGFGNTGSSWAEVGCEEVGAEVGCEEVGAEVSCEEVGAEVGCEEVGAGDVIFMHSYYYYSLPLYISSLACTLHLCRSIRNFLSSFSTRMWH